MRAIMAVRQGFLLAATVFAVLVIWWALSGSSGLPAFCKATSRLTLYHGPFSSLCLHHYLSREAVDLKESI
jgi:hypothetical protein